MELLELVAKAKQGDKEAFARLYDLYAQKIFRFIKARFQDQGHAEDLLQEVFLKIWSSLPQFKIEGGNFNAWAYKIAANTMNDRFRKLYSKPQETELAEGIDVAGHSTVQEDILRQEDSEALKKSLEQLPGQYREVLELRFMQELSVQETARILNKSNLAVRLLQHRALKKLRDNLTYFHELLGYTKF